MKKFLCYMLLAFLLFSCNEISTEEEEIIDHTTKWEKETGGRLPIIVLPKNDGNSPITKKLSPIKVASKKLIYDLKNLGDNVIYNDTYMIYYYSYKDNTIKDTNGISPFFISGNILLEDTNSDYLPFILTSLVKGSLYYNDILKDQMSYAEFEVQNAGVTDESQKELYQKITFNLDIDFPKDQNMLMVSYQHSKNENPYTIKIKDIIVNFDTSMIVNNTIKTSTKTGTHLYTISYIDHSVTYRIKNIASSIAHISVPVPHILIEYDRS